MKIYVCYRIEECEGTYEHAVTNDEGSSWIAFPDETQAKKWVSERLVERENLKKQRGFAYFTGAEYKEIELEFPEGWILPFNTDTLNT